MPHLIVDTDVLIEYLRGNAKAVRWLENRSEELFLSSITVAELFAGAREGEEEEILDRFLAAFTIVPPHEGIARSAGNLRRTWGKSHGTGLADALIAATALDLDLKLATFNKRHFPMLKVVVPYRR